MSLDEIVVLFIIGIQVCFGEVQLLVSNECISLAKSPLIRI